MNRCKDDFEADFHNQCDDKDVAEEKNLVKLQIHLFRANEITQQLIQQSSSPTTTTHHRNPDKLVYNDAAVETTNITSPSSSFTIDRPLTRMMTGCWMYKYPRRSFARLIEDPVVPLDRLTFRFVWICPMTRLLLWTTFKESGGGGDSKHHHHHQVQARSDHLRIGAEVVEENQAIIHQSSPGAIKADYFEELRVIGTGSNAKTRVVTVCVVISDSDRGAGRHLGLLPLHTSDLKALVKTLEAITGRDAQFAAFSRKTKV